MTDDLVAVPALAGTAYVREADVLHWGLAALAGTRPAGGAIPEVAAIHLTGRPLSGPVLALHSDHDGEAEAHWHAWCTWCEEDSPAKLTREELTPWALAHRCPTP